MGYCGGDFAKVDEHWVGELADGRRWVWVVGSPVHAQLDLRSAGFGVAGAPVNVQLDLCACQNAGLLGIYVLLFLW